MDKDAQNNAYLLSLLKELPRTREGMSTRGAKFVCALAVAKDGVVVLRASGEVAGKILEEPRGADGFGYDPLFLVPGLGRTMAELSREEKWEVSHRGRAFRELLRSVARGQLR
jgi:XTP/dITP diphosphohydrolase